MSAWAIWYRNLVIAWLIIGLPGAILGALYSGGDFELPGSDIIGWFVWLATVFFMLSPFVLWPWRSIGRKEGFD
jgi:hypothetical protein